jgi:hypothetical protein
MPVVQTPEEQVLWIAEMIQVSKMPTLLHLK